MARIRKFVAYRSIERPYTRVSKFRKKSYIKATPVCRIVRFQQGKENKKYTHKLQLVPKCALQIRDHALESARQTSNRVLEKNLGVNDYFYKMRLYPHHILRENPLASGAGADRFSTGMSHSFGKPIGRAVQLRKGQIIFELKVNKNGVAFGKLALERASKKLPCKCTIIQGKNIETKR